MGVFSKTQPDGSPRQPFYAKQMRNERSEIYNKIVFAFLAVSFSVFAFQSWYFGSYYRLQENAYRLTVRIIDLDSRYAQSLAGAPAAVLGPNVVYAAQNNAANYPGFHLGWQYATEEELSMLKLTPDGQGVNATTYANQLVQNQDVFAVILIHPNATVRATEAAQQGSTGYDSRGAISFIYEEARNFFTEGLLVAPYGERLISSAINAANSQFAANFLSGAAANATAVTTAVAAMALSHPFGYSTFNLRPFDYSVAQAPTTAGAIYLIIFTFLISPMWHEAFGPLRRKLGMFSELSLALIVPLTAYFWLSLCYSLVTLAFHVPFDRYYGKIGFFLYWMMSWVTMTGLGFVMETMLSLLGLLFFPFFLLFWVIVNVAPAFYDIADMDHFYSYGFVLPVWNSVDATKSLIFGTKNHLVQNFVVNLGWVIASGTVLASVTAYQRRQADREELAQHKLKHNQ